MCLDDFTMWYRNHSILRNTPGYNWFGIQKKGSRYKGFQEPLPQVSFYEQHQQLRYQKEKTERTKQAVIDMISFRGKYRDYKEFDGIFKAMEKAKSKLIY